MGGGEAGDQEKRDSVKMGEGLCHRGELGGCGGGGGEGGGGVARITSL